ncbi:MAG: hypothetical protein OXC46_12140 [Thaumarchaeota archaeon]|nr:hypothetical protein [Nitrososphaerota archaeon]
MNIKFQTAGWDVQTLEDDLKSLKTTLGFPCEFSYIVNPCSVSRSPDDIAIAFYAKNEIKTGIPLVEMNSEYFEIEDMQKRILILLHEIIHCCQRVNELEKINIKYMVDLVEQIIAIEKQYLESHYNDAQFYRLNSSLNVIGLFSSWIFEIWDEMYLKTNYSDIFEVKLEITFERIGEISDSAYDNYGKWSKYAVFTDLVRACYLKKIAEGLQVSEKFEKLFCKLELKLEKITTAHEFNDLMSNLKCLTHIEGYANSDTSILEASYDKLIEQMINDLPYP